MFTEMFVADAIVRLMTDSPTLDAVALSEAFDGKESIEYPDPEMVNYGFKPAENETRYTFVDGSALIIGDETGRLQSIEGR